MKAWKQIVAGAVLLAACADKKSDQNNADTAAQAGDKIVIAMIAKSSSNPVFLAARTGAEAAARELTARECRSRCYGLLRRRKMARCRRNACSRR